ncbi:hypothetical protein FB451DRAFT_1394922 [Mycena latifolia]|nr:hypothetical protein FB451DRAFT_1394922 [Mycena latifolia]
MSLCGYKLLCRSCFLIPTVCVAMSLLIQDIQVHSLVFAHVPHTTASSALASRLPPSSNPAYLFTVTAGVHGPFSFTLLRAQSGTLTHDVVLVLDWSARFRDSLIYSGMRLPRSFNSFEFFSTPRCAQAIQAIRWLFGAAQIDGLWLKWFQYLD